MKRVFFLLVFFCLSSTSFSQDVNGKLATVSASLIEQISSQQKKSIAIIDFNSPAGNVSALGKSLANKLRINIAKDAQNITIVNRSVLKKALAEEQLFKDGIIDPATAKEIKFKGIDALLIGEIYDYGNDYSIELQLIDTETSDIIGGDYLTLPKTESLKRLNDQVLVLQASTNISSSASKQNTTALPDRESFYPIERVLGDLRVKILDIKSTGNGLTIDLKIFNDLDVPAEIGIYVGKNGRNSTKINNNGDIYYSSLAKVANDASNKRLLIAQELISGKSWVNCSVTFSNVPKLDNIELLQIGIMYYNNGPNYYPLELRGIPVSQ
jgi:hypothetical protein